MVKPGQPVILKSAAETPQLPYLERPYTYKRRRTREVMVGSVGVGGNNPIRVQSMTTTLTKDVEATLAQTLRLVEAGCEIVRITTPTSADARALGEVKKRLVEMGIDVPLVADIHFSPAAAMEAALWADKVRINPGNFADEKRFNVREYTDEQYAEELARIEGKFTPLVLRCKERGVAMRIGTNHGSLSDRVLNRFGDTPEGMVESAIEFAAICRKHDYHDLIFSMKASNPKVMIEAYRLLVARLDSLGWDYPLHLGVTEAGNAEDGRIKSAAGIGALLDDGLGDTIRVSLTEDPEYEVPVAFALVKPYNALMTSIEGQPELSEYPDLPDLRDPYHFVPRPTYEVATGAVKVGGMQPTAVVAAPTLEPGEDAFAKVAALARRKGPNGIRPDIIRVPLANLGDISPLAEELRRRSEEEDPNAGKSALALVVDAGGDFAGATAAAPSLAGVGALALSLPVGSAPDWDEYEAVVRSALERRVPLWLRAVNERPDNEHFDEVLAGTARFPEVDLVLEMARRAHALGHRGLVLSVDAHDPTPSYLVRANRLLSSRLIEAGRKYPVHLVSRAGDFGKPQFDVNGEDEWLIGPSIKLGSLLCDGIGQSVEIEGEGADDDRVALAFNVLQAAGARTIKAEFVACPSCGRTLFDLQETTERIKASTGHLRGVKIAVMGCIVNGLGELADADFGYMGGAPDRVNLFVGKECVEKGVPTEQAVDRLIDLIKAHGKWTEPPAPRNN
ncbi:MAG TPA: (E)-4-hydroxy-3-methylbut-2-enyl-diphosphate synthase [Chloroflexia bacterium]|nr:(E)-4-hydroxy-3-methylbut-2-enyl-diphosphate synthase [Chloroflexia bacterium]